MWIGCLVLILVSILLIAIFTFVGSVVAISFLIPLLPVLIVLGILYLIFRRRR